MFSAKASKLLVSQILSVPCPFLKSLHTSPLYSNTSGAPSYHHVVYPVLHHLCVRSCLECCLTGSCRRDSDFNIFSHVCGGTALMWASRFLDSHAVLHSYWASLSWKNTFCVWALQRKHRLKDSNLSSQQPVRTRQRHVFEAIFMKTQQQFLCCLLWPHPTQSSQKILCRAQCCISLTVNAV